MVARSVPDRVIQAHDFQLATGEVAQVGIFGYGHCMDDFRDVLTEEFDAVANGVDGCLQRALI